MHGKETGMFKAETGDKLSVFQYPEHSLQRNSDTKRDSDSVLIVKQCLPKKCSEHPRYSPELQLAACYIFSSHV